LSVRIYTQPADWSAIAGAGGQVNRKYAIDAFSVTGIDFVLLPYFLMAISFLSDMAQMP
jgi:hypothetical protein